jgi:hypothetical protein
MSDKDTIQPSDSIKDLDKLREQIQRLSQEVSAMKEKTTEAQETLQALNQLMERIESRKQNQKK